MSNAESEYLLKQVFSVVIVALLVLTFYMLTAGGLAGKLENSMTLMLLILLAVVCIAILSEVSKINLILSKKMKKGG